VYLKPLSASQIEQDWSDQMIEGFYELGKDFPDLAAEIFAICR
jgi:general stress protein 26